MPGQSICSRNEAVGCDQESGPFCTLIANSLPPALVVEGSPEVQVPEVAISSYWDLVDKISGDANIVVHAYITYPDQPREYVLQGILNRAENDPPFRVTVDAVAEGHGFDDLLSRPEEIHDYELSIFIGNVRDVRPISYRLGTTDFQCALRFASELATLLPNDHNLTYSRLTKSCVETLAFTNYRNAITPEGCL